MIPVAKPTLGEAEVEAARRAILSGWVTQGPEVAAFEKEFGTWVGAPYACAVSNCTSALHLALMAVGVGAGEEVITASHSFIATANSIRYCGAVPVFVDIEAESLNMDPTMVEAAIGPRTRAILCVHQGGMPCDLAAITEIAARHGLLVIEDAACAAGSEVLWNGSWQKIGRPHGDIACFSFHPRKLMTTGDGGMITTARGEWDAAFRKLRQHGMSIPDTVRHNAKQVVFESYPMLGYNYRMTDIQAAVGREQLKRMPEIVAFRRERAGVYAQMLARVPGVQLLREPSWARSNWQSFCVRLPEGSDQRKVMQAMLDDGIATRRGIMCSHRENAYRREPWISGAERGSGRSSETEDAGLRHSEKAQDHMLILPLYHGMSVDEVGRVVESLKAALAAGTQD